MRTKYYYTILLAVLCGVSLPLASDIEPRQPAPPAEVAQQDKAQITDGTGSRLRCWQYGELLFEASALSTTEPTSVPGAIEFKREETGKGKLQLVNVGTATCLYEE